LKVFIFNSKKYDYVTSSIVEGLYQINGVGVKFSNLGSYAKKQDVLFGDDLVSYCLLEADIIILGSNHLVDHDTFFSLNKSKAKKVYLDGWDSGQIGINFFKIKYFDYIFKTNLYKQENTLSNLVRILLNKDSYSLWKRISAHKLIPFPYFHGMKNHNRVGDILKNILSHFLIKNIYPLPFGIEDRVISKFNNNPEFLLSCMIRTSRVIERNKMVDFLKNKQKHIDKIFLDLIPFSDESWKEMERIGASDISLKKSDRGYANHNKDYYHQLNNSIACISIPGGGFETFRYWEILASGSLLVSKRNALKMPNELVEGVHYLGFDTINELDEIINFIIANPNKIRKIRREGYNYSLNNHRSVDRAKYLISTVFCE